MVRNPSFTTWTKAFWSSALLVAVLAMAVVSGMKPTFTRRWWSQSGPDPLGDQHAVSSAVTRNARPQQTIRYSILQDVGLHSLTCASAFTYNTTNYGASVQIVPRHSGYNLLQILAVIEYQKEEYRLKRPVFGKELSERRN